MSNNNYYGGGNNNNQKSYQNNPYIQQQYQQDQQYSTQQQSYNQNLVQNNTTQQQDSGMSYQDYIRGGSRPSQSSQGKKQQTFADDGFDLQDFYGTKKKTTTQPVQQIQDNFDRDAFYGKSKQPVVQAQPTYAEDGLSYSDYIRGNTQPKKPVQSQSQYQQQQYSSYDQSGYNQNQGYTGQTQTYNNTNYNNTGYGQQYQQQNTYDQNSYYDQNQGYDQQYNNQNYFDQNNQNQQYDQSQNYYNQQPATQAQPVQAEEEWSYADFVKGGSKKKTVTAEQAAFNRNLEEVSARAQQVGPQTAKQVGPYKSDYNYNALGTNNSYQSAHQHNQSQPQKQQQTNYNYAQKPVQNPYYSQQQNQQSYNRPDTAPQKNEYLTEVAGDVAVQVARDQLTYENYEANKQHLTKENAEKAYQGAVWANDKADELGIDKMAVAQKVGSAMWSGTKYAAAKSQEVDWSKAAASVQK